MNMSNPCSHRHISSLDTGPKTPLEPGHAVRGVELQRFDRLAAGQELQVPHQHRHSHLQLQESKPHTKASPWALSKSLESMRRPEKIIPIKVV